MDNLFQQKIIGASNLFDDYFLDAKMLYAHRFNRLPETSTIHNIDGEKAFEALMQKMSDKIVRIYRHRNYINRTKAYSHNRSIVVMEQCVVEILQSYCELWHDPGQEHLVNEITGLLASFKERVRRQPLEINLIVRGQQGLHLKGMEIKRTKLDLDLFYNKDFKEVDALIRSRLGKKKDKGIVLLHGLPGTGKTTYLRYLIGKIKKRVLFLSPSVADNLMNPEFIELLINNPETVVIIEDAENIIMDRKHSPGSSVSNLLNISDGLLADFLNIQLVCTFNNSLTLIDEALMRKGRLIAKYEFEKLAADQAQRLSDHLGFNKVITRPMTIAEIANQHEKQAAPRMEVIGFRRHLTDTTHSLA